MPDRSGGLLAAHRYGSHGAVFVTLLLLLPACESRTTEDTQDLADSEVSSDASGTTQAERARPGIRFAPDSAHVGDRVGALILDSIAASPTIVDSTHVGTARFVGDIALAGSTFLHPDADLRSTALCFEVDDTSAARLPRWKGDERRPWFCFENAAEARRLLGPPSEGVAAGLVIDRFTIHRGLSDEVNSARLVRVNSGAQGRASGTAALAWLAGCWEQDDGDTLIEERWLAPRGDVLLGMNRTTRGDSLLGFEFMRILDRGDTLVFSAQPSGAPPSDFPAVESGQREILFENEAHDFPQRVRYRALGTDSLVARIEGSMGGSMESVDFNFARVECR